MKIELHILQNFAPSNLNRDDTGAPKDCELGGYRRGRISSQCMKRAIREAFVMHGMFASEKLAVRTKRLVRNVADVLADRYGHDIDEAERVVAATLSGAGLGVKGEGEGRKTEYLLFLPRAHIDGLAAVVHEGWEELLPLVAANGSVSQEKEEAAAGKKSKRGTSKADKKKSFPREIAKKVTALFKDGGKTPDLALFGRMIADEPSWNVEAACQVAQAISTNRFVMDFDFYTAIDDLKPEDAAGSDMMGTIQFSSSCFYRYSVVDIDALRRNLEVDDDLVQRTVGAWLCASVLAIPTGKQNSMAAHNPPSFVLVLMRESGAPVSLANAFAQPVRPAGEDDLVAVSIRALGRYLQKVSRMYGVTGLEGLYIADRTIEPSDGPVSFVDKVDLNGLVASIQEQVAGVRG